MRSDRVLILPPTPFHWNFLLQIWRVTTDMSQWDFNYIMELVLHLFFIFQKILWLLLYPLPLIEQQTWWQLRDDTEAPFFLSHILSSFSPASFWGKGFLSVPVLIPAGVWLRCLRGNRHGELLAQVRRGLETGELFGLRKDCDHHCSIWSLLTVDFSPPWSLLHLWGMGLGTFLMDMPLVTVVSGIVR